MRLFVSGLLSLCMVLVSSLPLLPLGVFCSAESVAIADVHASHGHQAEHMGASLQDWQTSRIECGCGCHRSIDSLPQVFAPHIPLQVDTEIAFAVDSMIVSVACIQTIIPFDLLTPPPKYS